jgi:2',3'-cyclic-nucleotide 2'-phosphodiesterase (5'-nucleotidase family)
MDSVKKLLQFYCFLLLLYCMSGCAPVYQATQLQYKDYSINKLPVDSSLQQFLVPYRDSMSSRMDAVIATIGTNLEKKKPEGTLGNMIADAMFIAGENVFGFKPDAAFLNYGGMRLNQLAPGPVTVGKVYELFPFDNLLVIVTIKGTVLQQFLDHTAASGGYPLSGMTMQIQNKKAVNVVIGGKKLNPDATYSIVVGDYTANGGDDCSMLIGLPQLNKGYLMRTAIIDYMKAITAAGKTIQLQLENRVTNVE